MRKVSLKNVSIIDLMVTINQRYSKQTAVQIKDDGNFRKINYKELGSRTGDTAYNLMKIGIERGERVAILAESRPEWSVALFGIISCAAVTVPMDTKLSETEVKFILNDSGAKAIFVSKKYVEMVLRLKPELPNLQTIILLDNEVLTALVLRLVDFKVSEGEKAYRKLRPDDLALIVYTSGTTGSAKGVELTYRNLLFEIMSLYELIEFSSNDHFLSILPLNHMLEITGGLFGPLYAGSEITYCDSLKPTTIMELMKETKTSVMLCVPLVLKMFHNGIFKKVADLSKGQKALFDFLFALSKLLLKLNIRIGKLFFGKIHRQFGGQLRCFVSGGAPLDPQVELDFNALGFHILQGYGLTETSPVITVNNFRERKYGSVGKPLPGIEVKILTNSETGGAEGEIITKGPHVMKGYYRNEAKTLEVLRADWFYTGDIGYFDRDGFLYISGRIKNLIVLGAGKKVFPEEVEEVMNESQFIKEICVLGRIATKGMRKGCEEVYAVVVPNLDNFPLEQRGNKAIVSEKISAEIARLGEKMADYKRIIDFEMREEELPKTSTRKIKRKVLLDQIGKKDAAGGEKAEFPENIDYAEDELTSKLKEIALQVSQKATAKIVPGTNFYNDLGIDSLMKVEILARIEEKIGVNIPDTFSYQINTFNDLVRFTRQYQQGRSGDKIAASTVIVEQALRQNSRLTVFHSISYYSLKLFFRLYFRREVQGLINLPAESSFIIAANHSSMLDFPLILVSLPYARTKNIVAPAAQDYFYDQTWRQFLLTLFFNTFPFERMGDFVTGMHICAGLIRKGKSLILFPEGTRSKDNQLQPFKPGVGALALDLHVPIVPVYIENAFKALAKGNIWPRPVKIRVHVGQPIYSEKVQFPPGSNSYEKYVYLSSLAYAEVKKMKEYQALSAKR